MLKRQTSFMSKLLNPLSVRSDRPLDPWTLEILRTINGALQEFNCRYMLMSVAGLDDTIAGAVWVSVDKDLLVPVASLPGLAVLKLFAWADRRANKDATDLHRILRNYADAGSEDRLYGDKLDILEKAGFDMELAGSHLLASDVVELCSEATLQNLRNLFSLPDTVEDLENQMVDRGFQTEEAMNQTTSLLQAFVMTLTAIK